MMDAGTTLAPKSSLYEHITVTSQTIMSERGAKSAREKIETGEDEIV